MCVFSKLYLLVSVARSKPRSEGQRVSLRSWRTMCVRRWTCWEPAAATCCPTPSVPTRCVPASCSCCYFFTTQLHFECIWSVRSLVYMCSSYFERIPLQASDIHAFPLVADNSAAVLGEDGPRHVRNPRGLSRTRTVPLHHAQGTVAQLRWHEV